MAIAMQQSRPCFNTQLGLNKFLELRKNLCRIYGTVAAHIQFVFHDSAKECNK